jgi:hypothetical protein
MSPPLAVARKEPSGFMNKMKSKINKLADHLPDSWGGDKGVGLSPMVITRRVLSAKYHPLSRLVILRLCPIARLSTSL